MKRPIAWHEECLGNMRHTLKRLQATVAAAEADRDALANELLFRAEQIDEAKRRGMAEFDNEKLLVKRGQK